jgi:hypothetical protein
MKNKNFNSIILMILSLVMLINFTSAAITLNPNTYSINIEQGDTSSFTFNISNEETDSDHNVVNFSSIESNLINSEGTIPSTNIQLSALPTEVVYQTTSDNIIVTVNVPSTTALGTYTGNITISGTHKNTSGSPNSEIISLTINVIQPTTFCTYNNGVSDNLGELEIKIKDITVTDGYGDDEEWGLLDEIEVEIEVQNKGDYDVDDISLEWGIANEDMTEWVIEMDEEDEFNLKDGKEENYILKFTINEKDLDLDFFELNKNYKIYARITGTIEDKNSPNDGNQTCIYDSQDVDFLIDSDFLKLDKLTSPDLVSCGDDVQITADIWNIGDNDQEEVYIIIFNKELGISKKIEIGDVDSFDKELLDTMIKIPKDVEEKTYYLKLEIYDEDNDIFESDEFDKESEFFIPINVKGNCILSAGSASVSASLDSEAKEGEKLIIKTTILNTGENSAMYSVTPTGYSLWASSATIDIPTFTLNAEESKQVIITLQVREDASGENYFNIEVVSGEQIVKNQPVTVIIESKSVFSSISDLTKGKNLIWVIGFINVLLVIVIIVVAVKVSRK